MFGGWSVNPKVSVFLTAFVPSTVPVEDTVRARSISLRLPAIVSGCDQSVDRAPVVARFTLIELKVALQLVRSSARYCSDSRS